MFRASLVNGAQFILTSFLRDYVLPPTLTVYDFDSEYRVSSPDPAAPPVGYS